MDKSGMIVGGAIGAAMAIAIIAVLFISPPESLKSETNVDNESPNTIAEATPLFSKSLSLIEIFDQSEPGVVRVMFKEGKQRML